MSLGLSKNTLVFEIVRASYAVGISTGVTTILVFGAYVLEIELPGVVLLTGFLIGLGFLPVGLYFYDRYHEHDLVLADFGHAMVRPLAFLYRILRT